MRLRIRNARTSDVGRGIARLDRMAMRDLEVRPGDLLAVTGKATAYARAMPANPGECESATIRVDGITRTNARAGLNDEVEVVQTALPPLHVVVLQPLGRAFRGRIEPFVLEGIPVRSGDRIRPALFGRQFDYLVARADPEQGVVTPSTTIKVQGAATGDGTRRRPFVSYEDIGGVQPQLHRIREMIELPLRYPELFERVGIGPPQGVLLYGPPGTGKTLIARAVAHETDAHLLFISGPEIIGKYYGESEAHLRKVFSDATSNAPSIIFIDEIDAIAPKREDVGGEKQVERRTVAQLLSLMDGLNQRERVIVIATTNVPHLLDAALRRPGRFDREIEIPAPDREGRREILDIHTRGMPLAEDVDLDRIAALTHGYVGADLAALCREAAMHALRAILPHLDLTADFIPADALSRLIIGRSHFDAARTDVEPSALREWFVEIPTVSWADVGGLSGVKDAIRHSIEVPLQRPALIAYARVRPPAGILLHGPPGTGKTLVVRALAHETNSNIIAIKGPQLVSRWVGESERAIRDVFHKARMAAPCILFFDEIDAIAPQRGSSTDSGVTDRIIAQLLTEMDGIEELRGVVVMGATNRIDRVDPALLRPGRFDQLIAFPLPDEQSRLAIFEVHTTGRPLADDVRLPEYARQTAGFSGADIEGVCTMAALQAVCTFDAGDDMIESFSINDEHFRWAIRDHLARGTGTQEIAG